MSEQQAANRKLYISDWHYGHNNILAFDNRPFKTVEDMNAALVERWNAAVHPGDTVYVLGDMFWCNMQEAISVLNQLNGQVFLIKGNHDRCSDGRFLKKFVKVTEYLEVEDSDRKVVLCHYPIPCFKNHFLMQELYGHPCLMYNVGSMMPWMDYTPRTLDEILRLEAVYKNEAAEPPAAQ